MKLTQEEIVFLLRLLDQVSVQGTHWKRMVLNLMEKLEAEVEAPEDNES